MFGPKIRCVVVVGAQWGDEGKGKIVDVLAERADLVVRYQGGANAGHTVDTGAGEFVLHQIPSGILQGAVCVVGNGVVLDPEQLFAELDALERRGVRTEHKLHISDRADRKSTRLNSSHGYISYAVFCLKKKKNVFEFVLVRLSSVKTVDRHRSRFYPS